MANYTINKESLSNVSTVFSTILNDITSNRGEQAIVDCNDKNGKTMVTITMNSGLTFESVNDVESIFKSIFKCID